jgi:hypothetical protein
VQYTVPTIGRETNEIIIIAVLNGNISKIARDSETPYCESVVSGDLNQIKNPGTKAMKRIKRIKT